MKDKTSKMDQMLEQLDAIIQEAQILEEAYSDELNLVHPNYQASARNLVHYLALRRQDLRYLQKNLRNFGLSRLAKAERHVMASLQHSRSYISAWQTGELQAPQEQSLSIKEGTKKLTQHSKALLGKRAVGRNVRIMVTLPSEAAQNPNLTDQLVAAGMDTARINCAHDRQSDWMAMINHLKEACRKQKRKVSHQYGSGRAQNSHRTHCSWSGCNAAETSKRQLGKCNRAA